MIIFGGEKPYLFIAGPFLNGVQLLFWIEQINNECLVCLGVRHCQTLFPCIVSQFLISSLFLSHSLSRTLLNNLGSDESSDDQLTYS